MAAWIAFFLSSLAVVWAGVRLSRSGDVIAELTGLGNAWVGAVFIAIATSLPELATDVSAVRQGDHNLAIGDLFGSSMANMLILAIADLVLWRRRVLMRVAVNQALVGTLAIALTATALAGIVAGDNLTLFGIGWAPLLIAGSYLGGMRLLYLSRAEPPFEASDILADSESVTPSRILRRAWLQFGVATIVIVAAAPFLARSSADIADQLGVTSGVVGVAMLAITTSLPEVTVTVDAFRRGAYDMAVGNLLGSNCVNMLLFVALDVADGGGSLLTFASTSAIVAGLFALLMMSQTLFEVLNTSERRLRWIEPDAAFRILTYALGLYLVVRVGMDAAM